MHSMADHMSNAERLHYSDIKMDLEKGELVRGARDGLRTEGIERYERRLLRAAGAKTLVSH